MLNAEPCNLEQRAESKPTGTKKGDDAIASTAAGGPLTIDLEVVAPKAVKGRRAHLPARKLNYRIKHAIRGRLRIVLPLLASQKPLFDALQQHLSSTKGITGIDGNYRCNSVTIQYEFAVIQKDQILRLIEVLTIHDLVAMKAEWPAVVREDRDVSLGYLKLAGVGTGMALVLGGLPMLALPLVYPLLVYICIPVYKRAWRVWKTERRLNVDFLDAMALTTGMLTGDVINASLMVFLIHLGDYIRDLTAASSRRTIRKLLDFQDNYAWVVIDGVEVQMTVRDIAEGAVVVLNVGDLIPVDGEIIDGELIVDQQVLTGESMPVHKEIGDTVFASTVIKDGKAYAKATRTGEQTKVAQVVQMVENAPLYETKMQNHAEKFADRLVVPSLITTGLLFVPTLNLAQLTALLTVDFGTGIRISAPTAVLSCMISAASNGILIKGGSYLEKLYQADTIVFDKTGTLTTGVIRVEDLVTFNGFEELEMLSYAATAELQMTHPIAEAVVAHAESMGLPQRTRDEVKYAVGRGVQSLVEGRPTLVGSPRLMRENAIDMNAEVQDTADRLIDGGKACLYVAIDGKLAGIISFRDQVRPEAKHMIDELHRVGVKQVVMLTGDVKRVAIPVSKALGIDLCIAEMLPEQKAEVIIDLKEKGHTVAFVGDGINDSVALSYADIGFSVNTGADITKETAGVILLNDNLLSIPKAFEISKQTVRLIKENYRIVGVFNVVAYGLAAVMLASPVVTTLISNGSAVFACLNGMKPLMKLKLADLKTNQAAVTSTSTTDAPPKQLAAPEAIPDDADPSLADLAN
jgi:heavy metal translocating P-type ATPase